MKWLLLLIILMSYPLYPIKAVQVAGIPFAERYPAVVNAAIGMGSAFMTGIIYDFVIYPDKSYRYLGINPRISLLKSAVYPGWGQYYNGDVRKAVIYSGLFTGGLIYYFLTDHYVKKYYEKYSNSGNYEYYNRYTTEFTIRKYTFISLIVFYVYNFLGAYIDGFFYDTGTNLSISADFYGVRHTKYF